MPVTRAALKRKQREFDDVGWKDAMRPVAGSKGKGRPRPLHDSILEDQHSVERAEALRKLKMEDVIDRLHVAKREWEACDAEESLSEEEQEVESEGEQEIEKDQDFFDVDERALVTGWRDPVLQDFRLVARMPLRQRLKKLFRSEDKAEWVAEESLTQERQGTTTRNAEASVREPGVDPAAKDDSGKQKCSAGVQDEIGPESEEEENWKFRPLHGHIPTIDSDPEPSDGESEGTDLLWSYPIGHRIEEQTYPSEADFNIDGEAAYEDADDEWLDEEEYTNMVSQPLQRERLSEEEVLHMFKGNLLKLAIYNATRENLTKRIIEENWLRHEESVNL